MTNGTEGPTEIESLARELVDAGWTADDRSRIGELCSPDVAVHDPSTPTAATGPGAYERYVARVDDAFARLELTVEDVAVTDEKAVVRTRGRGTPDREFRGHGPADGTLSLAGLEVVHYEDGVVTEWSGALLPEDDVAAFDGTVRGEVVRPDDADYDDRRAVWNGLVDKYPALIVRCVGVADVIDAMNFARANDLLVTVRGGGHNVAGTAVCDGGLVVDLSEMTGVHVDLDAGTVRAEGGATWADVDRETQAFGLATPGGVVSTTGIAGLTLGGGLGWLRRTYGLTVDNLVSVDLVTADGEFVTASENRHRDLFWGLRGGGGNFGVVTSFEYRLHPVGPEVTFGGVMYPLGAARDVLPQWREYMADASEAVSAEAAFWTVPDVPDFPPEARDEPIVALLAVHCGPVEEGRRALEPLAEFGEPLVDLSGPMPYTEVQQLFDPFLPAGELCYYWKSIELDRFDDEVIDAVVAAAESRPSPRTIVPVWHLGGAMCRVGASDTAYGDRDATYLLSIDSTWEDPDETAENVEWTRDVWRDMHRFSDGGLYLNFPGFGEEGEELVRAASGREAHDRLTALKDEYDPGNRFRPNGNVTPSA